MSLKLLWKKMLLLVVTYLSVLAVSVKGSYINWNIFNKLTNTFEWTGIAWPMVFLGVFLLYRKSFFASYARIQVGSLILAVLFSIFMILGRSMDSLGNLSPIFGDLKQAFIYLFIFIGYINLFYVIICRLNLFLDIKEKSLTALPKTDSLLEKHSFMIPFFVLIIAWLPWLTSVYPGAVSWDACVQINMFLDPSIQLSNHHPYISTLVLGSLIQLFRSFGNDNISLLCLVMTQEVVLALSFAHLISTMVKLKICRKNIVCSIAFFALLSAWPLFAVTIIKDTFYVAFFVFLFSLIVRIIRLHSRTLEYVLFAFFAVLSCLFRNNGIYIVASILLISFVFVKGLRKKLVVMSCIIVGLFAFSQYYVMPTLNVIPGGKQEMLSIPFQQTARYAKEHDAEVTQEEKDAINSVLNYETIKENYLPGLADYVKQTFKAEGNLKEYFKVWWQQFMKHPDTYIEATLANMYGYFYPNIEKRVYGAIEMVPYIVSPLDLTLFDVHQPETLNKYRDNVYDYSVMQTQMPVLSLLFMPATYTWVLMYMLYRMWHGKKKENLIFYVPVVLTLAVCCISPVNGCLRYMLPIMAVFPLLIGLSFTENRAKEPDMAQKNIT